MITTRLATASDALAVATLQTRSWRESHRGELSDSHVGAMVRTCRYVWSDPSRLAAGGGG